MTTAHQGASSPGMPWCRPPGGSRPCSTWNGCRRGTEICKADHGKLEKFGTSKDFSFFLMEAGGNHFKKNLVFLEVESQWNPTCSTCSPEQTSRDGSGMGQRWDCKTDGLLDDSAEKKAKFMVRSHISIHKWD